MRTLICCLFLFWFSSALAQGKNEQPQKIIVGVKHTPPFIIKNSQDGYSGISIALWEEIAEAQNLDYEYREYDLEGLLDALSSGKIEVCINPLTVTSERVSQFDFTQPFYITNLSIAVSKSGSSSWMPFIRNFFSLQFFKVVGLLLIVLLIFGLLVWVFERHGNTEEFGKGIKGVWSGLWWSAVTMTTVGYGDKSPKTTGGRVVALIWMFTAVIIISGFTASIASALTVTGLESSIEGPKDLKKVKTISIRASTGAEYLRKNDIDYATVPDVAEGLKRLADEKVKAFVYDEPILKYSIKEEGLEGAVRVLPATFATQYYGFALPKSSPLLEKINPQLLKQINGTGFDIILEEYGLGE